MFTFLVVSILRAIDLGIFCALSVWYYNLYGAKGAVVVVLFSAVWDGFMTAIREDR